MRPVRLSTLLIALNVSLLLLAVVVVVVVAAGLLQQLAGEQALARVEQAAGVARQQIDVTSESVLTSAQLLSERPTLPRLVAEDNRAELAAFLLQFQQTSQLDAAAVLRGGAVIAQSGPERAWPTLVTGSEPRFLVQPAPGAPLLLGAWAAVPAQPDLIVAVALELDAEYARQLQDEIGLPVTIGEPAATGNTLRQQAISRDQLLAARIPERDVYLAVAPLHAPDTTIVGVIETELPTATTTRSVQQLTSTLVLLALGVALLAGVLSLLLGRRVARPLGSLTLAAARIGRGDLETPVAHASGAEIGTLSMTLEDMRGRLLRLTSDLRRQQAEAEAIVTGIVEGVYTVDRERRIRYLNRQAAALLGTTVEAAIGQFCGDVLNPQGVNGVRPCAEQCPIIHARFRDGARATERLMLPNGQRRTVVITSAPSEDGLQVQVLRDETEIEATRRLRDAILANISHEFRTPLSAQLASIELLLDQLPDLSHEQIGQLVRSQQRGTLRLTQLIDNLLESARIEAGQHTIRMKPVALDEVIEEALELTRPLLEQRRQQVVVDLPYPLPLINGDARRLTQVFVNLLGNAHKFAPAASTITIGGAIDAVRVQIWVEDQGPGLPLNGTGDLFDRFVRSGQDEPEQSGVGLGLWLVKWIVERHGGRVAAQNTGHGTRIVIALPRGQSNENSDR